MKIIIIGGGIIGCLNAYYLHQEGYQVSLLEKEAEVASLTSAHNGAQLSYSYVSPLGNPAIYRILKQMLFGQAEDVKITQWRDPQLWHWGVKLLTNSSQKKFNSHQKMLLELALESRDLMTAFLAKHQVNFTHHHNNKIHLYPTQLSMDTAKKFAKELETHNIHQQFLTPKEVLDLEPSLATREGALVGGMLSESDDSGDSHQFALAIKKILEKNVTFKTGVGVKKIHTEGGRFNHIETTSGELLTADACIVCAGAESYQLLKTAGIHIPLYPVKGYTATVANTPRIKRNITDHQRRVVFAPLQDKIRVAGLMHFSGYDYEVSRDTAHYFASLINGVFPNIDTANLDIQTGLRPYTPTSTPVIGESKIKGLYLNIGQGMLGWTLAHASGKRLAKIVTACQQHYAI